MLTKTGSSRARQRGVGLLETMVGLLIGMLVVLVVYNIMAVAEGYKRNTISTSDAQVTGLLSQFVAGRDAANGGAGITMSAVSTIGPDLIGCINDEANNPISGLPVTALDAAVRPIPLLITDGGGAAVSDSFISLSTGASHVMWPVDFLGAVAAGQPISVQSPNGFTVPVPTAAAPYWAIVMTNDGNQMCKVIRVIGATAPIPVSGSVTLTQEAATATTISYAGAPSRFLNMGPQGQATRIQYDVDAVNSVLRTTDLLVVPPAVLAPNPIAQNVVLMKVQYGIDNNGDGIVDFWTPADASSGTDFSSAAVRAMALAQLNQILAVRVGVVVRGDEPDLKLLTNPADPDLKAQAVALKSGTRPAVVLFNCSANTTLGCPNRVVVPAGPGVTVGSSNCAPAIICDYWRYRTYETVIPLRNAIYSATMP